MQKQRIGNCARGAWRGSEGPVQGMSLRGRLRAGVSWNALASIAGQGSALLASLVVANLLGRDSFGQFSMVFTSIITLGGIAQAGSGVTATRYLAEYRDADPPRARTVLRLCAVFTWAIGLCAALVLVLAAPWLAESVLRAPELGTALAIGAAAVLFSAVNGFQIGALAGLESYRALARTSLWQAPIHLSLCAAGTWVGDLNGAVGGLAFSAWVRWLL